MVLTAEVYSSRARHPPLPCVGGICRDAVHNRTGTRTRDPWSSACSLFRHCTHHMVYLSLGMILKPCFLYKIFYNKEKSDLLTQDSACFTEHEDTSRARLVAGSTIVNNHVFTSPRTHSLPQSTYESLFLPGIMSRPKGTKMSKKGSLSLQSWQSHAMVFQLCDHNPLLICCNDSLHVCTHTHRYTPHGPLKILPKAIINPTMCKALWYFLLFHSLFPLFIKWHLYPSKLISKQIMDPYPEFEKHSPSENVEWLRSGLSKQIL